LSNHPKKFTKLSRKFSHPLSLTFIVITISLLFIYSCEKEYKIGLDQLPEEDLIHFKIDSAEIQSFTYYDDSVPSSNVNSLMLGSYVDPAFGITQASMMFQLMPGNETESPFGESSVGDSAILYLGYNQTVENEDTVVKSYGQFRALPQNLKIYELNARLRYNSIYYAHESPSKYCDVEGRYLERVNYKPDYIIKKTQNYVKIKLPLSFARSLVDIKNNRYMHPYLNDSSFFNLFRGFYIKSDNSDDFNKAIVHFNTDSIKMQLYYRNLSDTDKVKPEYNIEFTLTSACARANLFEHNYSNLPFANHLGDTSYHADYVYVQPMGGLKTKLNVKLPKLKNGIDSIAIVKAELVVESTENTYTFPATPTLNILGNNSNSKEIFIPEYTQYDSYGQPYAFGESYDKLYKRIYRFNITKTIIDYYSNKSTNNGFSLVATDCSTSANRVILNAKKTKLYITYKKL